MRTVAWTPPAPSLPGRTVVITERQAQVLDGLFLGRTFGQIARQLGVTLDTIATHRRRLYRALGAVSVGHAVGLVASGQVVVLVRTDAYKAQTKAVA